MNWPWLRCPKTWKRYVRIRGKAEDLCREEFKTQDRAQANFRWFALGAGVK